MARVVAITGASAGLGRATAIAFGRRGDRVGLIARSRSGLEAACREVEAAGGQALALPADVADPEQIAAAAERLEQSFGPIDVWVNNAMATIFSPVAMLHPAEFRRATEVTYLGYVWGTMEALRRMRQRDQGVIVQVGSALAYRAIPLQAPYCGAKFAIRGFTDALRSELLHEGSRIRLIMVQMPALNTPQFQWARTHVPRHPRPVPPVYAPELAAEAIVWVTDNPRRELWVGSSTVKAVLANKIAPGMLDRYLAHTGFNAQQMEEPVSTSRPDNLFAPVEGLHRTHGRFTDQMRRRSGQLFATQHRSLIVAAALVAGAATAALLWSGRAKDVGGRCGAADRAAKRDGGRTWRHWTL